MKEIVNNYNFYFVSIFIKTTKQFIFGETHEQYREL